MSKRTQLWLIITIPVLLFASGCIPECTPTELEHFNIWTFAPNDGDIVSSLTPTFEWYTYEDCRPDEYRIETSKNVSGPGITYYTAGTNEEYTIPSPLDPGSKYHWKMYSFSEVLHYGKTTREKVFYTGPMCPGNTTPIAPILDFPEDGGYASPIYESGPVRFHWYYPYGCLPSSFLYEFATDPGFINIVLSGETDHNQFLDLNFPDCSTLWWRVAAKNSNNVGPWSDIHKFYFVYNNECWQNHYPSDDVAELRGRVYRDECSQTGKALPSNTLLGFGCTKTQKIGIHANGVHAAHEHGLINVTVDLGTGPCPSTGLDQTNTVGPNGRYQFNVLTPGEYCVSVSKNQTGHDWIASETLDLMDGLWTEPLTTKMIAEYTVTLGEGYHEVVQDFGWDEYDGMIKLFKEPTYCRIGIQPWCDQWTRFEIHEQVPVVARNAEGSWLMTIFEGVPCYFFDLFVLDESTEENKEEYAKEKEKLEVFEPPEPCPSPTPTPRPKPSKPGDPCAGKSDRECKADPNCTWVYGAAAGYCTSK